MRGTNHDGVSGQTGTLCNALPDAKRRQRIDTDQIIGDQCPGAVTVQQYEGLRV
jgi:hypothetical protein